MRAPGIDERVVNVCDWRSEPQIVDSVAQTFAAMINESLVATFDVTTRKREFEIHSAAGTAGTTALRDEKKNAAQCGGEVGGKDAPLLKIELWRRRKRRVRRPEEWTPT